MEKLIGSELAQSGSTLSQQPDSDSRPTGTTGNPESGNAISDVVTTVPCPGGGTKRPQEDHASIDYDGAEVEANTQRISSICLGIGSDDITGEVDAVGYAEGLEAMARQYRAALEADQCFVHIRTKRSSNKDLKMLSRMTKSQDFKKGECSRTRRRVSCH